MRRFGPVLAVAAVVAFALAIVEPSLLSSTVRSPRALVLLAVLGSATSVTGRIVARRWGRGAGRLTSAVAIGLAIWLLVVPALRQTTLDEAFPVANAVPSATTTTTTTTIGAPPPEPSVATTPESAPPTTSTPAPAPPARTAVTSPVASPPPSTDESAPAGSSEPRLLTTGRLEGIGHEASGSVSVFELADGSAVLRFDDVDIRNAPDPVLYLVPGNGKRTREGGAGVGALKATKGSFNHPVPASFDLGQPFTVFIWCDRYAVPIASADQQRA